MRQCNLVDIYVCKTLSAPDFEWLGMPQVQEAVTMAQQLEAILASVPSGVSRSGPARLGPHSIARGSYLQLPESWWQTFPQHRGT